MKILVTGGAGFVGSNVAIDLISKGHDVFIVDDLSFGSKENIGDVPFYQLGFEYLLEKDLLNFDVLVHCATSNIIYAIDFPIKTFKNNAINTVELFNKFKGKIVYTSTASVYGQADNFPTTEDSTIRVSNAYDQSKYIVELFLRQRGNYTTLRLSNVYGVNQRPDNPYCGVIGKVISEVINGEEISVFGDGSQTRDFTYISDVVRAIGLTVEQKPVNTEVNIATGRETSVNELIELAISVVGNSVPVKNTSLRKIDGIKRRCLSVIKASEQLNWKQTICLEEGLVKTIEWFKENLYLKKEYV